VDFTLNFYTTFYLFIGQNPANVFTNFGQHFYTHFYYSDFLNIFFKGIPDDKNRLLHKMGRGAFGHGSKMILNIFLVYFFTQFEFYI
jgi:hypothetical protein